MASSLGSGQPARRQLGVREIALGARVGAVEEVLVGPLEVERVGERVPHPRVGEERPPRIVGERLHPGRDLVLDLLLLHEALLDRGEVVARRPALGGVLLAEVVGARLEGLERHGAVAVVVVAQDVEVVASHVHGERRRPVVRHAAVGDGAAGLGRLDAVGAGAEGRLDGGPGEVARRPVRARQHGELAHDERQLAIHAARERKAHGARPHRLGLDHAAVVRAEEGPAARLQRVEAPDHVGDGDGAAVVKARLRRSG